MYLVIQNFQIENYEVDKQCTLIELFVLYIYIPIPIFYILSKFKVFNLITFEPNNNTLCSCLNGLFINGSFTFMVFYGSSGLVRPSHHYLLLASFVYIKKKTFLCKKPTFELCLVSYSSFSSLQAMTSQISYAELNTTWCFAQKTQYFIIKIQMCYFII